MAALVMQSIDDQEFQKYIRKIMEASTTEILSKGIIGTSSELSSAQSLKSEGSLSQAWSNAMYIEFINFLY
jgi:hypothetical protein